MKNTTLHLIFVIHLLLGSFPKLSSQVFPSSRFLRILSQDLVLQILPKNFEGEIEFNEKKYPQIAASVFLPYCTFELPINYPLRSFLKECSISQKWRSNYSFGTKPIECLNDSSKVLITKLKGSEEEIVELPERISNGLFQYFQYDIDRNESKFIDFDCFAFASLICNVKYNSHEPPFDYKNTKPNIGEIVVLSTEPYDINSNNSWYPSIKHWALYLGDDVYLSKFGATGHGKEAPLTLMNLEGMKLLYNCDYVCTAYPKKDGEKWNGYPSK